MIKTNFLVTKEEKDRILSLHESATKKLYLVAEDTEEANFNLFPPTKEEINLGMEFCERMRMNPNYQSFSKNTTDEKFKKLMKPIENAIMRYSSGGVGHGGNPTNRDYGRLGRYLKNHPDLENQIINYSQKVPKIR